MSGAVQTRLWRKGELESDDFPFAKISDHLAEDDTLVWADLVNPDSALLDRLADELDLSRLAIEDATTMHERPKAVRYDSHLFITMFDLRSGGGEELRVSRVSAFVLQRGLITVRLDEAFDMSAVLKRWDENADLLTEGPLALLYGLLDEIVDGYFTAVEYLDDCIEGLEDSLFDDSARTAHDLQRRTFTARKELSRVRKLTLPMREVVTTLLRRTLDRDEHRPLVPYYEDLYDHTLRAADWTDSLRDAISSIYDTNLSLADIRMNTIMKKLTSWAAIIAVPTAITGWFGQNVPYPGFGREWGVVFSFTVIVLIAAVLYLTFKRKDWL